MHRLEPGDGLYLGGVLVPAPYAAVADSDGDVLLHALLDAILGAAGLGDIGEWFPASSVAGGQRSILFFPPVLERVATMGGSIVNVDGIVDLERPRLSPFKPAIRDAVAKLLGISPEAVNIKAKTSEGLGPVGESGAVAAQVVALLEF